MTQNLPKLSNFIGFIDSRSKNLLQLAKKKCEKNTILLKFGIFGSFLRFSMISHFLLLPKSMISDRYLVKMVLRHWQKNSAIFDILKIFPYRDIKAEILQIWPKSGVFGLKLPIYIYGKNFTYHAFWQILSKKMWNHRKLQKNLPKIPNLSKNVLFSNFFS